MGLLDLVSDMLSIHNLLIILLFLFIVYVYYLYNKLESKINKIFPQMIDMINVIRQDQILNDSNKKIYLEQNDEEMDKNESGFKNNSTSLIEVSDEESDEQSESSLDDDDYDTSSNESFDDDDDDNIKTVHLSLDLDKIEDINVLLIGESNEAKESHDNKIEEIDNTNIEEINLELEDIKENLIESEPIVEIESDKIEKRKKESRKNNSDGDYKKMHLPELKKYVMDKNIYSDPSKLKKPELLKLIEEYNNKGSIELDINDIK
jgi:hypothetical protein